MVSLKCSPNVYRRSKSEVAIPFRDELTISPLDINFEERIRLSISSSPLSFDSPKIGSDTSLKSTCDEDACARSRTSSVASVDSFASMNTIPDVQAARTRKSKPAPWKKLVQFVEDHKTDDRSLYTTVLLRNIPTKYVNAWLIEEIQATGNRCNFVHMPMAKKFDINLGYAFINFVTPMEAQNFLESWQGHQFVKQPRSAKRATVEYSSLQGFEQNVDFYSARRVAKSKYAPWILRE
jgi:hypothetical protein